MPLALLPMRGIINGTSRALRDERQRIGHALELRQRAQRLFGRPASA